MRHSDLLQIQELCDICLRSDGKRQLQLATLLEIQDNKQAKFSYPLSCFLEMRKPAVMYRAMKILPFDILDLCVINANGKATVVLSDLESFNKILESYTNNYKLRFAEVLNNVKTLQRNKSILDSFLNENAGISARNAKDAYGFLESLDPNMKVFDSDGIAISFPVSRIARLSELITIDIVKEYGIALSRIGHPFDFSEDN